MTQVIHELSGTNQYYYYIQIQNYMHFNKSLHFGNTLPCTQHFLLVLCATYAAVNNFATLSNSSSFLK